MKFIWLLQRWGVNLATVSFGDITRFKTVVSVSDQCSSNILKYLLLHHLSITRQSSYYIASLQGSDHNGRERILARHRPRLLPQLPDCSADSYGWGSHDLCLLAKSHREATSDVWLGMLVLQDARLWLHVHGFPSEGMVRHTTLLELHLLYRARVHLHLHRIRHCLQHGSAT